MTPAHSATATYSPAERKSTPLFIERPGLQRCGISVPFLGGHVVAENEDEARAKLSHHGVDPAEVTRVTGVSALRKKFLAVVR